MSHLRRLSVWLSLKLFVWPCARSSGWLLERASGHLAAPTKYKTNYCAVSAAAAAEGQRFKLKTNNGLWRKMKSEAAAEVGAELTRATGGFPDDLERRIML